MHQVNAEIVDILGRTEEVLGAKPAGKGIRGIFAKMRDRLSRSKDAEERERHLNAAASTVPVGAVAHDDIVPGEERIKKEAAEHAHRDTMRAEVISGLETQPAPLNGTKSTGELHPQNGDKPMSEKAATGDIAETNPPKEPHS